VLHSTEADQQQCAVEVESFAVSPEAEFSALLPEAGFSALSFEGLIPAWTPT
jgi:hypothetical protein